MGVECRGLDSEGELFVAHGNLDEIRRRLDGMKTPAGLEPCVRHFLGRDYFPHGRHSQEKRAGADWGNQSVVAVTDPGRRPSARRRSASITRVQSLARRMVRYQ